MLPINTPNIRFFWWCQNQSISISPVFVDVNTKCHQHANQLTLCLCQKLWLLRVFWVVLSRNNLNQSHLSLGQFRSVSTSSTSTTTPHLQRNLIERHKQLCVDWCWWFAFSVSPSLYIIVAIELAFATNLRNMIYMSRLPFLMYTNAEVKINVHSIKRLGAFYVWICIYV